MGKIATFYIFKYRKITKKKSKSRYTLPLLLQRVKNISQINFSFFLLSKMWRLPSLITSSFTQLWKCIFCKERKTFSSQKIRLLRKKTTHQLYICIHTELEMSFQRPIHPLGYHTDFINVWKVIKKMSVEFEFNWFWFCSSTILKGITAQHKCNYIFFVGYLVRKKYIHVK